MNDLIHARELIEILHDTAFKDEDDRSIACNVIEQLMTVPITTKDDNERAKMIDEIQHWMNQCKSYERTIVKLAVALADRGNND